MLTDEELGAVLAERLQALVGDVQPSHALIERLDAEIIGAGAMRRGRRSRRLHRRIAAFSIPVWAAVAAAIVLLVGSNAQPSFAVTRSSDGFIRVTIRDIEGVSGANKRLRELGVTNVVVVPMATDCSNHVELSYIGVGAQRPATVRLKPEEVAPGWTVILAAAPLAADKVELALGRVTGAAPSCVAPGKTGPGISKSFPHKRVSPSSAA
jgi:hypothetical protein